MSVQPQEGSGSRRVVAGIVAHVDAGKTTLSEALLYRGGEIRTAGRVDDGTAFLDTSPIEKSRGITVFTHQAHVRHGSMDLTLLDTPGHADFAAQTERTLAVLDCAILVVSASDGVEGTTRLLWRMLRDLSVPVFVFVNKTDMPGFDRGRILRALASLSEGCVDFSDPAQGPALAVSGSGLSIPCESAESVATLDDAVLEGYLASGTLDALQVRSLVARRRLVPCLFGSALHLRGADRLLDVLGAFAPVRRMGREFGAKVFRVSHPGRGERLTWLRVTGGTLHAKQEVTVVPLGSREGETQKADELRVYDGRRFETVPSVPAGGVCAVAGLTGTWPGEGLGSEPDGPRARLRPVLLYRAVGPSKGKDGEEQQGILKALRVLDDEDPLLRVEWNPASREVDVRVMGEIQVETLVQILRERFGLAVDFEDAGIVYAETISRPVEGVGHFEPLRHYAEVHVLLEPAPRGSGLTFVDACPPDSLATNWRRDIMSHLRAKEHRGVLVGAPLTDVRITLLGARANITHTVGGDFREASWRAVRQGLMELREEGACVLLEPWYRFRLDIDRSSLGRAMSDVQRMQGELDPLDGAVSGAPAGMSMALSSAASVTLTGRAPVSRMRGYAREVRSYTHGSGRLTLVPDTPSPCLDQEEVVERSGYDPLAFGNDTPDSVFCAHGAGYTVGWKDVPAHMHLPYLWHGSPAAQSGKAGTDGRLIEQTFAVPVRRQAEKQ